MHFLLEKNQKLTLFEQAREQLLTALHLGKLRAGDRLPSVRQISQRSGINIKTAFSIYQRLKEEGYIELRTGSGAYIADVDKSSMDQDYCLSIYQLIKSNLAAANHLKLDPRQYYELVQNFVEKPRLTEAHITVVECNEEQVNLFTHEISSRVKVRVSPILLDQLERPDRRAARLLAQTDYFATTDYHFKQVRELVAKYKKKILQLRVTPTFLSELVAAARRGRVVMVVSNTSFFLPFRHNLVGLGIAPAILDRITPVDGANLAQVRADFAQARSIYISPICNPRIHNLIPPRARELKLEDMLSAESIEAIEAALLFHNHQTAEK